VDQALLEIGHNYTIQAVIGGNCIFTNWTDGNNTVLTTNPLYSFTMVSNLTLNATFLTNPIIAGGLVGNYNGLFSETNLDGSANVKNNSAGGIASLHVGPTRTFTGTLKLHGHNALIHSNYFDCMETPASRSPGPALPVDRSPSTCTLIGSTGPGKSPDRWSTPISQIPGPPSLSMDEQVYSATAAYANTLKFDGVLPPNGSSAGYLPMRVVNSSSGLCTVALKSPDGTSSSGSVAISTNGRVPLFFSMNQGAEIVHGWLQVGTTLGTVLSGTVSHVQDASGLPALSSAGFTNANATVAGSVYDSTASPLLSDAIKTNFDLVIQDGDTGPAPLTVHVYLKGTNFVKAVGSTIASFSGSIVKSDGSISMSFRPTGAVANKSISGVILQGSTNAFGFWDTGTAGDASKTVILHNAH